MSYLPNSVLTIGASAFANCSTLALKQLPTQLTLINTTTFQSCTNLLLQELPPQLNTIGLSAFQNCNLLGISILPVGVTILNSGSLQSCLRIVHITLSPNTTSIGANTFNGNVNTLTYTINNTTPPTLVNISAFTGINAACKIYVPDASVDAYKAATNWITYASYIYPLSTKP
jgi:hypothetical protein